MSERLNRKTCIFIIKCIGKLLLIISLILFVLTIYNIYEFINNGSNAIDIFIKLILFIANLTAGIALIKIKEWSIYFISVDVLYLIIDSAISDLTFGFYEFIVRMLIYFSLIFILIRLFKKIYGIKYEFCDPIL